MNLADELDLLDDGDVLSKEYKQLEIGKLLGVESQTCNEITNKGWNMVDIEMEGKKLMQSKQIFKTFPDKIDYLICPDNPTFNEYNDVQVNFFYQSL